MDWYRIKLIFTENEWIIGVVNILLGCFIGLFGLRYLRPIAAIMVGLSIFFGGIIFSSIFGYFDTVKGLVLTLLISLVGGIILGIMTLYIIWLAIGALGVLGGFFLGSLIYELTLMQFDFAQAWAFMTLTITGVISGIILSFTYGKEVIVLSTSLFGGLAVMQGTCRFFPQENRFP